DAWMRALVSLASASVHLPFWTSLASRESARRRTHQPPSKRGGTLAYEAARPGQLATIAVHQRHGQPCHTGSNQRDAHAHLPGTNDAELAHRSWAGAAVHCEAAVDALIGQHHFNQAAAEPPPSRQNTRKSRLPQSNQPRRRPNAARLPAACG